ncbi:hypothetical protein ACJJTC_010759 [Scirpophaga incertulas]
MCKCGVNELEKHISIYLFPASRIDLLLRAGHRPLSVSPLTFWKRLSGRPAHAQNTPRTKKASSAASRVPGFLTSLDYLAPASGQLADIITQRNKEIVKIFQVPPVFRVLCSSFETACSFFRFTSNSCSDESRRLYLTIFLPFIYKSRDSVAFCVLNDRDQREKSEDQDLALYKQGARFGNHSVHLCVTVRSTLLSLSPSEGNIWPHNMPNMLHYRTSTKSRDSVAFCVLNDRDQREKSEDQDLALYKQGNALCTNDKMLFWLKALSLSSLLYKEITK